MIQIDLQKIEMVIVVVALVILFGPERFIDFGRDLHKAWRDFWGMFRRRA